MSNSIEDIPFCDVFHPTVEEFENFCEYMEKVTKLAKSGIFKVVPPKSWKARKDNYKKLDFLIPHPIEQIVNGKDGIYEVLLLQRESRQLSKYQKLVESFDKITENKKPSEIEKLFWKTLKFSSPLYGADAPGSLFDKGVKWNLSEIDSLLKTGLGKDITGVTTPYLYIGSWKSMFCWHKEDLDLYSINYLHFGRPKCWYGIPQEEHKEFEEIAKKNFQDASKECPEFLRHKTHLMYPMLVKNMGITVHKCIQSPGEFVVTKCASYHAGFNMGFNCAEAVNFALMNWIDYGKQSRYCKCSSDNVKIDLKEFMQNISQTKKNPVLNLSSPNIERKSSTEKKEALTAKKRKRENEKKSSSTESSPVKPSKPSKQMMFEVKSHKEDADSSKNLVENWVCCDSCNKWRKIPKSKFIKLNKLLDSKYDPALYLHGFVCNFIKNLNCESDEENWRDNYTTLKRKYYTHKKIKRNELKEYFNKMKNSIVII